MERTQNSKIFSLLYQPVMINELVLRWTGVLVFIILTALGAFVKIPLPFTPVPITLQTFFVLLSGAMLGRKFGTLSQAGYLFLGVAGVPLFCGTTAGISYLFGPTGGYLFGFIIASFLVGLLLDKNKSFIQVISVFMAATLVIYFFGIVWLMVFLKFNLLKAVLAGAMPFIAGDIIKLFVAAAVYEKLKS